MDESAWPRRALVDKQQRAKMMSPSAGLPLLFFLQRPLDEHAEFNNSAQGCTPGLHAQMGSNP